MIYLDNAATTKVSDEVVKAMLPYMTSMYGNAGSVHSMGRSAHEAIEEARKRVATPINADPSGIIFTSCASEANNMAILGLEAYLKKSGKTHIITSNAEHPSVLEAMKKMSGQGFFVTYLPINSNGCVDPVTLKEAIREDTGLVSIMGVNNELGSLNDLAKIGEICGKDILFHTDCVQAYGNTDIDVKSFSVDFLSASGHKIHAPKGVGFLYAADPSLLKPLIVGGGQENGLRSGTENVPGIVALGVAAQEANLPENREHGDKLVLLIDALKKCGVSDFYVNVSPHTGSRTVNLRFYGVDGETLVMMLSTKGVMVSAGSACSAHSAVPSHVLKAIGLTDLQAKSSIRVSISRYTRKEELLVAAQMIADCVQVLRR